LEAGAQKRTIMIYLFNYDKELCLAEVGGRAKTLIETTK